MNERTDVLSPGGAARRETMLVELTGTMHRIHRRRRTERYAIGVAAAIILAALPVLAVMPSTTMTTPSGQAGVTPPPIADDAERSVPEARPSLVTFVRTDDSALDRYTIAPERVVERIDDDALLTQLTSIDRPAGIIRRGDRVSLTRDVTDDAQPKPATPPGDARKETAPCRTTA